MILRDNTQAQILIPRAQSGESHNPAVNYEMEFKNR